MGREEVGDGVAYGVGLGAPEAHEGAGDDSFVAFFFHREIEPSLAPGAGEDVHDFSAHFGSLGDYSIGEVVGCRVYHPLAGESLALLIDQPHRHPNHPHSFDKIRTALILSQDGRGWEKMDYRLRGNGESVETSACTRSTLRQAQDERGLEDVCGWWRDSSTPLRCARNDIWVDGDGWFAGMTVMGRSPSRVKGESFDELRMSGYCTKISIWSVKILGPVRRGNSGRRRGGGR